MKCCVIILMLLPLCVSAQELPDDMDWQQLNRLPEDGVNTPDLEQWALQIEHLRNHPLRINFAEAEALSMLGLDIFQINNLLQYRRRSGYILSPYELIEIKGWDRRLVESLLPMLDFTTHREDQGFPILRWMRYARQKLIFKTDFDLQKRRAYREGKYAPQRGNYQLRYKLQAGRKLSAALHLQQDAGESWTNHRHIPVPDFISFSLQLQDYKNWRKIVLGDYQIEWGQGLACWSSFALGKTSGPSIKKFGRGVSSYQGGDENRFLRGVAGTYRWRKWDLSGFYSHRSLDARWEIQNNQKRILSLPSSGLHRSESEKANKDQAVLQMAGIRAKYTRSQFSVALNAVHHQFNHPLAPADDIYRYFTLDQKKLSTISIDGNYLYKDLNIFGEWAMSDNTAMAATAGIQFHPADAIYLSLLYRHFEENYQFVYHAPLAETGSSGERGFLSSLHWSPYRTITLNITSDNYYFPWARYGFSGPSRGRDLDIKIQWELNRYCSWQIRHRRSHRAGMEESAHPAYSAENTHNRTQNTMSLRYRLSRQLSAQSSLMKSQSSTTATGGLLIFQDLHWEGSNWPLKISGRLALCDIPDYALRLYAYEYDLSYSFSAPAYYGEALKFYLTLKYQSTENLQLQLKFSHLQFSDRREISSGLNTIEGNTLHELRTLLIYKF